LKKTLLAILLAVLILTASAYGVYNWFNTASPSSPSNTSPVATLSPTAEPSSASTPTTSPTAISTVSPTTTSTETTIKLPGIPSTVTEITDTYVLVTDCYGGEVKVTLPVERIAVVNSGFTEIIFALGCGDKLVGRDSYSTFPSAVQNITVFYGSNGFSLETLTELDADLVIADSRVSNDTRTQIENTLGIPVIIDNPSDSNRVESLVMSLGIILDKEDRSEALLNYMNNITNIVTTRLSTLKESDKPLVYYEWSKAWYSCSSAGLPHVMITEAGGINLAANQTVTYPSLSPEYVLQCNPDVIIRIITSTTHNETDFITMRNSLMTRTGLSDTTAVKEGHVYVMEGLLRTGIRNPIGLLTMAKWFYPDLFSDVDPAAMQENMFMTFIGEHADGTYYYP
jgi:iron complex transport system substrate-binding protein